jgi:hypothetical protein
LAAFEFEALAAKLRGDAGETTPSRLRAVDGELAR